MNFDPAEFEQVVRLSPASQTSDSLEYLNQLYEHLEQDAVRKAAMSLLRFDSWESISERRRSQIFSDHPKLETLFLKKREDGVLRVFFPSLIDFFSANSAQPAEPAFHRLLSTLLAQLPTRRVLKPILEDRLLHLQTSFPRSLRTLLEYPLNDYSAEMKSSAELEEEIEGRRSAAKAVCWKHGLRELGLASSRQLFGDAKKVREFLNNSPPEVVKAIVEDVLLVDWARVEGKEDLVENLFLEKFGNIEIFTNSKNSIFPTESDFADYDPQLRTVNTQFLSLDDYFSVQFRLYRTEAFSHLKSAFADAVARVRLENGQVKGSARMLAPISSVTVVSVDRNSLTTPLIPRSVRVDARVDLSAMLPAVKAEWDSVRSGDVVFLLRLGKLELVRGAEVVEILDAQGTALRGGAAVGETRTFGLKLEGVTYDLSIELESCQLMLRLNDSNFKSVLHALGGSGHLAHPWLPSWLTDLLIGYGHPSSADPWAISSMQPDLADACQLFLTQCQMEGLTLLTAPPGTGQLALLAKAIANSAKAPGRTLIITRSNETLNLLLDEVARFGVPGEYILKQSGNQEDVFSRTGRINHMLALRLELLGQVRLLALSLGLGTSDAENFAFNCDSANQLYINRIRPLLDQYLAELAELGELVELGELGVNSETWLEKVRTREISLVAEKIRTKKMPIGFEKLPGYDGRKRSLENVDTATAERLLAQNPVERVLFPFQKFCADPSTIELLFSKLTECAPFEILRTVRDRSQYLLACQARVVGLTSTAIAKEGELGRFANVFVLDATQMFDFEPVLALSRAKAPKCLTLVGDDSLLGPTVMQDSNLNFGQSLFARLCRIGCTPIFLNQQVEVRQSIANLFEWRYPGLVNVGCPVESANSGFTYDFQFVNVSDYMGKGELEPSPHQFQNLGEAEFVVSVYMYLRLKGHTSVSILTPYKGQKNLIQDVLQAKCAQNPLFPPPTAVTTVDQYQGQVCDIVLLSLVRTQAHGHLKDIKRFTLAMSRARLGLYVFGRFDVFRTLPGDMGRVFEHMSTRGLKLSLQLQDGPNPCSRSNSEAGPETLIDGVEHMWRQLHEVLQDEISNARNSSA